MQRTALTALVGLLVVSAGCTGLLTGDTVEFTANEASVGDSALESTGYEGQNATEQTIERDVEVGGQARTVRITNHYAVYARTGNVSGIEAGGNISGDEVPETAQFAVFSTPGAQMAGQSLNPAARLSNQELIERLSGQVGSIEDVEFEENRTTESLDAEREVSVFTGTTTLDGQEIDVRIHVASFEHEGDVIIATGVHPVQIEEDENIDELLGGIEHSGDDG